MKKAGENRKMLMEAMARNTNTIANTK